MVLKSSYVVSNLLRYYFDPNTSWLGSSLFESLASLEATNKLQILFLSSFFLLSKYCVCVNSQMSLKDGNILFLSSFHPLVLCTLLVFIFIFFLLQQKTHILRQI
jgi:hypothetical protein